MVTTLTLEQWLQQTQRRSGHLLIGGVGHLLLSRSEEEKVERQLAQEILPRILTFAPSQHFTLFMGLAPGADLMILRHLRTGLRAARRTFSITGLLALPPEELVQDWVTRAAREGYTVTRNDHGRLLREVDTELGACDYLVRIGEDTQCSEDERLTRHRRLTAVLAQRSDILVAVLRGGEPPAPGGTAEAVRWFRDPAAIPAEFRLPGPPPSLTRTLYEIEPGTGLTQKPRQFTDSEEAALLEAAEEAMRSGNDLLCNDIVYRALKRGAASPKLHYLKVLSLANTGSTELALDQYAKLAPEDSALTEAWLSLRGRLEKDLALRGMPGARKHFFQSAEFYREAFTRFGSAYSAINAASMLLLAGESAASQPLAQSALKALGEPPPQETACYFHHVTAAEAALVLGDVPACQRSLAQADAYLPDDFSRRGRTLRQLRRLCKRLRLDSEILAPLRLPPTVVLRRSSNLLLDANGGLPALLSEPELKLPRGAVTYVSVCDPLDLRIAERVVEHGGRLHLALPTSPEDMERIWTERYGTTPAERLAQLLPRTHHVTVLRGFLASEHEWSAQQLATLTVGLSLLTVERMGDLWQLMDISGHAEDLHIAPLPPINNARDNMREALAQSGYASSRITQSPAARRMVGLIFADFAGFQRVTDQDLPRYWSDVMGGLAEILNRHGDSVLLRQTWGDALHVVTEDALSAARIAADIRQFIELRQLKRSAVLSDLKVRIAAHYAPVYIGEDPVQRARTYYGSQLSFTARIEPVAPPGTIYVTESFAARLTLESPGDYALEYAGEVELAKNFGTYRLFTLQRVRYG